MIPTSLLKDRFPNGRPFYLSRLRDANLAKRGISPDPDSQLKAIEDRGLQILEKVKDDLKNEEMKPEDLAETRLELAQTAAIENCVEAAREEAIHTISYGEAKRPLEEEEEEEGEEQDKAVVPDLETITREDENESSSLIEDDLLFRGLEEFARNNPISQETTTVVTKIGQDFKLEDEDLKGLVKVEEVSNFLTAALKTTTSKDDDANLASTGDNLLTREDSFVRVKPVDEVRFMPIETADDALYRLKTKEGDGGGGGNEDADADVDMLDLTTTTTSQSHVVISSSDAVLKKGEKLEVGMPKPKLFLGPSSSVAGERKGMPTYIYSTSIYFTKFGGEKIVVLDQDSYLS